MTPRDRWAAALATYLTRQPRPSADRYEAVTVGAVPAGHVVVPLAQFVAAQREARA